MAQVDTGLYGNLIAPVKSVADYSAEMDAADQRNLIGQQNRLSLQSAQQAAQDDSALRSLYARKDFDPMASTSIEQIMRISPKAGMAAQKSMFDARKASADLTKTETETRGLEFDQQLKRRQQHLQQLVSVSDLDGARQWIDEAVKSGEIQSQQATQVMQRLETGQMPFAEWKQKAVLGGLSLLEQLNATKPKIDTVNTGGQQVTLAIDPLTGQQRVTGRLDNTQSPDNKASVGASYANAAATREVAQSNRDAARIQTGFKNEKDLREEFNGLPEVKNYKQAYPAYAAVKDAASRNTPQADINLVYGIAKLYDPTSVVREGEYATVANSPNIPERIKGYAQYIAGGGKLSPETKKQILAEATGRIGSYKAEVDKAKGSYTGIASRKGIAPEDIFQGMGDSPSPADDIHSQADKILRGGK